MENILEKRRLKVEKNENGKFQLLTKIAAAHKIGLQKIDHENIFVSVFTFLFICRYEF